ncbi:hypothetical protein [Kibdelosporangium aridum]|uniref:hypothetical protein n=1 Tax=Kibdelosporangium aridum TaxID=2030 RepID=UPI000F785297|nr:hypothetical protein [Kibdelosporangium aridum]
MSFASYGSGAGGTMTNLNDFLFDPHSVRPWTFTDEGVCYEGAITTTPYVCQRLNRNGVPERTSEGDQRWALWTTVTTGGEHRGFCIQDNTIARGFGGRAVERNLRRWADQWKVGGTLTISWNRAEDGTRMYRNRYTPPSGQ